MQLPMIGCTPHAEGLCLAIDVCVLQLLLQLPHGLGLDSTSVSQRSWNLTKFPSPCEIRLKTQNTTFLYCIAHTSFIPIAKLYSLTCTADFISQELQHILQEHAVFNPSTISDRQHQIPLSEKSSFIFRFGVSYTHPWKNSGRSSQMQTVLAATT